MNKELVINVTASEITIALLEDGHLVELNKEKSNSQFSVGDIFLGKVKKVMPGLNAAFVNIGYEKDAFLHYLDLGPQFLTLNKYLKQVISQKQKSTSFNRIELEKDIDKNGHISDVLTEGQIVLVQIAKEPISTKGPRLSSEISVAGRNLVLIPFSDKVSVSQKIELSEERNRLKRLIQSIVPKNYGVIVRTVAEGRKVAELDMELRSLVKKFESALTSLVNAQPPKLVIGELSRTSAIIRDYLNSSFNSIYINDVDVADETREYIKSIAPDKQKIIKLYDADVPIFEYFGVEKQIKASFGRTVAVKKGAYLVIEHTEALHVIDVNSGTRTTSEINQEANALDVNLAAAEEIARQLRLRDMGGIIVIDFIDLHEPDNRQSVYEKMKEFMSADRAKHHILPLSKFGLMQITRQRVRPEMNIDTNEKCPSCKGSGKVSPSILLVDEIENNVKWSINATFFKPVTLKVHPYIAAYLNKGFPSIRLKWRFRFKKWIHVQPVSSYNLVEYHFFNKEDNEILL